MIISLGSASTSECLLFCKQSIKCSINMACSKLQFETDDSWGWGTGISRACVAKLEGVFSNLNKGNNKRDGAVWMSDLN